MREFRFISLLILALAAVVPCRGSEDSRAADAFWTADKVHTIHIRIDERRWQAMQPQHAPRGLERLAASVMPRPSTQPSTRPVLDGRLPTTQKAAYQEGQRLEPNFYGQQFAYVKADFECDGMALRDIGFRLRGNSSYNWSGRGYHRPYRVDFNRFMDGQKLFGLGGFHLNNNAYDPAFMRETLAYEVFRGLGAQAPRTTYAMVYLTIDGRIQREYLGLYTLIEQIDSKAFLKDRFGSAKGLLLKPWSIRGLPYFGELWSAYESRYNPEDEPTEEMARRAIDFIKLVNYADDATFERRIGEYLDVDQFLRVVAGDVILSNLDTFLYTGHNFFMYLRPKDERFCVMPWDLNLAFANFTSSGSVEQLVHLSVFRPHSGEMKLIDRLMAIPRHKQAYREIIERGLADVFTPGKLFPRIDALRAVIASADAAADAAWAARHTPATTQPTTRPVNIPPRPRVQYTGWQGRPAIELKEYITRRTASLNEQLAGESDGYTPAPRAQLAPPPGGLRAGPAFGNLPVLAMIVMRSADSNCDSKLTAREMNAAVSSFFTAAGASAEAGMSQDKLTAAFAQAIQQASAQRRSERGDRGDRGNTRRSSLADPAAWAGAVLAAVDTKKTGQLVPADAQSAAARAFVAADTDRSGKLDETELLQLLDTLAASSAPPATQPAK